MVSKKKFEVNSERPLDFEVKEGFKMSEEKIISISMSKIQELLQLLSDAKNILHGAQTGKEELAETTAEEA